MKSVENEPVLILYNRPGPAPGGDPAPWKESEVGVLDQVNAFRAALRELGIPHRQEALSGLAELAGVLDRSRERLVINLVEAFPGRPFESDAVPDICEIFGRSCTGASTAGLLLSLDKARAKERLAASGLTVPAGVVVRPGEEVPAGLPGLPPGRVIVKPLRADASEGIGPDSIVDLAARRGKPREALRRAVARVHARFGQPALVEQFIEGRELNVSLVERSGLPEVLPIAEIDFSAFPAGEPRIVDYSAKWLPGTFAFHHTPRILPADLPAGTVQAVRRAAIAAWHALGCRDYTRVDFRLAADGTLYALEANLNPDVSPEAGFAAALAAWGLPFPQFVARILANARERLDGRAVGGGAAPGGAARAAACTPAAAGPPPGALAGGVSGLLIRRSRREDRDAILGFLKATGFFPPGDLEVAREVLDEALEKGEAGHYQSYTAVAGAADGAGESADRFAAGAAGSAEATRPTGSEPAALERIAGAAEGADPPGSAGGGEAAGRPVGWVCFGPTPCTVGTWDLYWIGVDSRAQARGVGTRLLEHAERCIRERGGRLAVIETSGRPLYHPTRQFYLRRGYREEGRIRDFYAPGDDRVIYTKLLPAAG